MPNILKQLARSLIGGHKNEPPAPEPRAADADVAVLDLDVLKELHVTLGRDMDRVRGVYAKFLDSTARRIDELRQQPTAASMKTLHALKGSAGMVGASRLAVLAARLQEETAADQELPNGIDHMKNELARFHGVLEAQLDALTRARYNTPIKKAPGSPGPDKSQAP